jgi:CRISPR-associated protein Cmr1
MTNTPTPADPALPLDLANLRAKAKAQHKDAWHSVRLELETITPVYGGGTTAGEPDLLLPFRPRAVKNSLRHWWWLLNRHKPEYKDDSAKLYQDMCAIWGGASDKEGDSQRAKIRVRVDVSPVTEDKVMPYMPFRIVTNKKTQLLKLQTTVDAPHFYALWMLKPKETKLSDLHAKLQAMKEERGGNALSPANKGFAERLAKIPGLFADSVMPVRQILLPGLAWTLYLDMAQSLTKNQKLQARDSLQAWLMLGGIGARSTRGLGRSKIKSVKSETTAFQSLSDIWNSDFSWFEQAFGDRHVVRSDLKTTEPNAAWESALRLYKNFRQARQQNEDGHRMKQSYGHLANSLRKLTGSEGHALPDHLKSSNDHPMPEVMFGTPIVYQFITKKGAKQEPSDGEVRLSDGHTTFDRYTSPLWVSCVHLGDHRFAPVSICSRHHASDLLDKHVQLKDKKTPALAPGDWWPDLKTEEGQERGLDLLAESYRNGPRPDPDQLYEDIMDAALREDRPARGDPILAYLNFFHAHQL